MNNTSADLLKKVKSKEAVVGIVGMGYVGLPLALALASAGVKVLAYDIDQTKIDALKRGTSYIQHIDGSAILTLTDAGLLDATSDPARLAEPDALLICVPTPLTRHYQPDLSFVIETTKMIASVIRKGQLVVLESTTYPGTTREIVAPLLDMAGLRCGVDYFLAYSPEREDPGNKSYSTKTIPKVVGADDSWSLEIAAALYGCFAASVVNVSSTAAAEAVKITENVFRSVNIVLVNELKLIFRDMDINVWEVIEAAKTKPFGYMAFYPGPGLGGHCIPIDPFYLTWKAREFDRHTRFIELAGEINSAMPAGVIEVLASEMDARFKRGVNGTRVLILGVAYKKNIDDVRESPALRIMDMLRSRGAQVAYYDPHVGAIPPTREHPDLVGIRSISWGPEELARFDAAIVVTDHDDVDYVALSEALPLIVDTRNACARNGANLERVVLA